MTKREHKRYWVYIARILFVLYLIGLCYFLFFSEEYGRTGGSEYHYNIHLFQEIRRFLLYRERIGNLYFLVNIVGNVVAFVPFGLFYSMQYVKPHGFFFVTISGLMFSLAVEGVQLVTRVGIFDVDDIFMNTIGVALGYGIYRIFKSRLIIGERTESNE